MLMLPYIKIYSDFIDIVRELDNGARGRLFLAILQYANGEEPDDLTGGEKIAFLMMRGQIDRDRDVYATTSEKRSAAGQSGAKKRWRNTEKMANAILPMANDSKNSKCHKDKDKDEEEDKDKEKDNIPPIVPPLQELPDSIRGKAEEWLVYKKERREGYKPSGLRSFTTQVKNATEQYGAAAVAELIDFAMSNGYMGITWDRLTGGRNASNRGHTQRHVPGNLGETI